MKVLLIGENGQLGWELKRTCPDNIILETCDYPKIDLGRFSSIKDCVEKTRPDCIINAAAYTAVDQAEKEKDLAFKINGHAVEYLAQLAETQQIRLVQISTDYIFDGKNYKPYLPEDTPCPVSVYGQSKLAGEQSVLKHLAGRSLIIRTAWLYSSHGANFVKTMLELMKDKEQLQIIDEQIGTPTWAYGLAKAIWDGVEKKMNGIFHWTDSGVASWYDFAVAIQEEACLIGLISDQTHILPIPARRYPTPAKRPEYAVLDKQSMWQATDIVPVHWRTQLRSMLKEIAV